MSVVGSKQTSEVAPVTSAFDPKGTLIGRSPLLALPSPSCAVGGVQLSSVIHSKVTPSFLPSVQITRQCRAPGSPSMAN
jgi:hypothetical protein